MRPLPGAPPEDLGDGVVTLRLRRESDAPQITRGRRDQEARRWLGDAGAVDASPAAAVERARMQWSTGRSAPFVIADARTDEPLGQIRLMIHDDAARLVYIVYPEIRGLGVATRAVRLITRWALQELGLRTIVLEADVRNAASIRVAEKAGYRRRADRPEPHDRDRDGDRSPEAGRSPAPGDAPVVAVFESGPEPSLEPEE
ncbi:GNAT family N-acetyltransferase [Brachybacterium phenoliresistens]|uniref:Acetyltransferase n=1 Tax=Brachybacterium phenoliresistens TaxID=396014 RepID=Z9JY43_9MICO|nr:GNAT family protein [Brachybacterium phenoliresistens]EWS82741.1 acetyltransferase [Brachybacterium phenoliresistens]